MAVDTPEEPDREARQVKARTVRRILLTIAVTAALVYAGAVVYLMTQETRLVFAAGRPLAAGRPAAPFEQVEIAANGAERQFGWVMRAATAGESAPWLLFLHGNAATVASRMNILHYEKLRALGLNVFAPEYRGFGGLPGEPSEQGVTEDGKNGYAYLRDTLGVPPERIVIYGWSLGSAVAVNVAADRPSAAVVLEGAPASLVAIGQRRYPWMPIRLVMRNPFESVEKIKRVSAPLLFIHSPEDAVIPIGEGRRLFEAAPGPKRFVEVRGGHIDPADVDAATLFGAVAAFLSDAGILGSSRHAVTHY